MSETVFDLDVARTLRSVALDGSYGALGVAHWCEWKHKHESSRSFLAQIRDVRLANWHRFIRPGSITIDIGAHSGDTTIPMGLLAYDVDHSRRGTVIAVEPNPAVFEILKLNIHLNSHIADFIAVQAAVTANGIEQIEISDLGTANCNMGIISDEFNSELKNRLVEVTLNKITVPGTSLAKTIREHVPSSRIGEISFIKIDCEGYDKEILLSSREVLSVIRPALYIEWFGMFSEKESNELFRTIEEIGYTPLNPTNLLSATVDEKISDLMLVPSEMIGKF